MLNNEFPPVGGRTGTVNLAILEQLALDPSLKNYLITTYADNNLHYEKFGEQIEIINIPVNRFNIHHTSNQELSLYAKKAFSHGNRLQ